MDKITNISELRTRVGKPDEVVEVLGYYTVGDNGGGQYYWDSGSTSDDNGGTIIESLVAEGRWRRIMKIENEVNALTFGAKADGLSFDNFPVWQAIYAYLKSVKKFHQEGFGYGAILGTVIWPGATKYYYFTETISLNESISIIGEHATSQAFATKFYFPQDTTGIETVARDLIEDVSNSGVCFEGIQVFSNPTNYDNITFHGFNLDTMFHIKDCRVEGFSGDGFHIEAPRGGSGQGSTDHSTMERCWSISNYNGVKIEGGDANAMIFISCNFQSNRRWGVWDKGFLGNVFLNCQTASNCVTNGQKTIVFHNGQYYYALNDGMLLEPGVDVGWENDWAIGATVTFGQAPDYSPTDVYEIGGARFHDGLNSPTLWLGCYNEGDQPPSRFGQYGLVINGVSPEGTIGSLASITGVDSRVHIAQEMSVGGNGSVNALQLAKKEARFIGDTGHAGARIIYDDTNDILRFIETGSSESGLFLTTNSTPIGLIGRSITIAGVPGMGKGLYLGRLDDGSQYKLVGMSAVVPTYSSPTAGDFILKAISSASDSTLGWRYTGSAWEAVTLAGGSGWGLTGNTPSSTDFIGSTNDESLRFRTNNSQRMVIDNTGKVGIGITTPDTKFQVGVSDNDSITAYVIGGGGARFAMPYYLGGSWFVGGSNAGGSTIIRHDTGTVQISTANSGSVVIDPVTNVIINPSTGRVGIGTASPNASALVDITSTTKGFLPPRMTGLQAEAISSPAEGLLVYINNGNGSTITTTGWWGYNGSTWVKLN